MSNPEIAVSVSNVFKSFGKPGNRTHVLKDISFDAERGEFVSIMGPSGCGKSTLLYIIGGLDSPDNGQVHLLGKNIKFWTDGKKSDFRRRNVGFVFQFYNLVQNLTVEENIMLPVIMDGRKPSEYRHKLNEILEITGLNDKRKSTPNKLSGGQQQRASIARSLIMSPAVILADEPTGNLDSRSGEEVLKLFKRINTEEKITILMVTHSERASSYGNRTIKICDGMIVE